MAKQKYKLGKMEITKIKKLAEVSPEAREYLGKRGFTWSESANKAKVVKKVAAKKTIGKAIAKKLPFVGAAMIARDVIKGVSKATCGKRGGNWVSGKCVGTKKTKFKKGSPVKDPISKR